MAEPNASPHLDEQALGRAVAVGLPVATLVGAGITAALVGTATSVLVLAAGLLLGVIALAWSSLRILSGDIPLPPELEALDSAGGSVDALAGRKTMLLRALKDLENERSIGKIEQDDYELIAATYRADLKAVLKRIDDSLEPYRAKAEEMARDHLRELGLDEAMTAAVSPSAEATKPSAAETTKDASRIPCPKCGESNEAGAKFCKECATSLRAEPKHAEATESDDDA